MLKLTETSVCLTGQNSPMVLLYYLRKEGRVGKLFYCLTRIKEPCVRKSEGLTHSKILRILQTEIGLR